MSLLADEDVEDLEQVSGVVKWHDEQRLLQLTRLDLLQYFKDVVSRGTTFEGPQQWVKVRLFFLISSNLRYSWTRTTGTRTTGTRTTGTRTTGTRTTDSVLLLWRKLTCIYFLQGVDMVSIL